jgi:hypothetical protein
MVVTDCPSSEVVDVRISGKLVIPPSARSYSIDRLRVAVRDVTEADGPAQTVAERELPGLEVSETGIELPFEIVAELDPGRMYAVRTHADRNGSGRVEPGDLVSTTAHIVGADQRNGLVITLEPVGG